MCRSLWLTKSIVKLTEDLDTKLLTSLVVKVLALIIVTSDAFRDVVLQTIEDAIVLTKKKNLETKEYIFRTEYIG